jgi:hypothetical protein
MAHTKARLAETAKLLCIPFFLKTSKDIFPYRSLAELVSFIAFFFSAFCHAVHTYAQIHPRMSCWQHSVLFSSQEQG